MRHGCDADENVVRAVSGDRRDESACCQVREAECRAGREMPPGAPAEASDVGGGEQHRADRQRSGRPERMDEGSEDERAPDRLLLRRFRDEYRASRQKALTRERGERRGGDAAPGERDERRTAGEDAERERLRDGMQRRVEWAHGRPEQPADDRHGAPGRRPPDRGSRHRAGYPSETRYREAS